MPTWGDPIDDPTPVAPKVPTTAGVRWGAPIPHDSVGMHVRQPADVGSGIANAVVNFLTPPDPRQHPVEFGLYSLQSALPFLGDVPGLGGLAKAGVGGALTRLGATTALGTGIGAATGKPVVPAAEESALVGAAGELPGAIASKASGLSTAREAATTAMREPAADAVAQRAIENQLGVTGAKAQALAKPTTPGAGAQELAGAKTALREARTSAIHEVGQKYDPIYGPIDNQPVSADDLGAIGKGHKDSLTWLSQRGAKISPSVQKTLAKMESHAPSETEPVITVESAGTVGGKHAGGAFKLTNEQIAQMAKARSQGGTLLGEVTPPPPTIGQMRGHLGQLMAEANKPGTGPMERRALMDASAPVIKTLQDVVPPEQRPLLQQINNEYSQINRILPFKNQQKLMSAGTLPQLGEMAFGKGNEAATSTVISRMNEPQKRLMRDAFGAYILNDSDSPTRTLSKLQANKDAVKALYPDSDFGKIKTWHDMIVGQKKFAQKLKGLPSQKEFEAGLKETIQKTGLTPEALQAANDALQKSGSLSPGSPIPHGFGRYLLLTGPVMGLMGWGPYHHAPELLAPAIGYYAGMLGWRAVANNPVALDAYRDFIMSGPTRKGADALGRLFVSSVNDTLRGTNQPEKQAVGHMPDMSEGTEALDKSRAEAIAPTPSASNRAEKLHEELQKQKQPDNKKKPPNVHNDLNRGRISHDELTKTIQYASSKDASKVVAKPIPLSEVIDALEQATPEELQILMPLVQARLRQELPQEKNMTLASNLSKRFQSIQAKSNQPQQQEQA